MGFGEAAENSTATSWINEEAYSRTTGVPQESGIQAGINEEAANYGDRTIYPQIPELQKRNRHAAHHGCNETAKETRHSLYQFCILHFQTVCVQASYAKSYSC